jgi:hypothetical protein
MLTAQGLRVLRPIHHSDSTRCGAMRLANEYGATPCN